MRYTNPNQPGSKVQFRARYENFIGGEWIKPVKGLYFENLTPVTGAVFARSPAPLPRTSKRRWMPHMQPRRPGAKLHPRCVQVSCSRLQSA